MTVEPYSDKYFGDILKIVENFHKEAVCEYGESFDVEVLAETIRNADTQNAFLMIVDGSCQGLIYGSRWQSPMSGKVIFQETIWYVNESFRRYGISLLREVEKLLKSQGVNIMIMAVLENSKTEKIKTFYERLGFKPMETHYMRSL